MLAGSKVSSATCECVIYIPEKKLKGLPKKLNFESLEMQK